MISPSSDLTTDTHALANGMHHCLHQSDSSIRNHRHTLHLQQPTVMLMALHLQAQHHNLSTIHALQIRNAHGHWPRLRSAKMGVLRTTAPSPSGIRDLRQRKSRALGVGAIYLRHSLASCCGFFRCFAHCAGFSNGSFCSAGDFLRASACGR